MAKESDRKSDRILALILADIKWYGTQRALETAEETNKSIEKKLGTKRGSIQASARVK